jgi:hypothetical protein
MMASTNNVITDETTKTVTIRQEAYTLEQGTFRQGYHHIIYATTVNVKKGFVNPGCDLTLYSARLVVDYAGGIIDVSGKDGEGFREGDRVDANTTKGNSYNGGDGKDGDNGKPGQNGGKVDIHAAHILGGTLEVKSRGGKGGRAQDGGNGMKGKQPTEQPTTAVPKQVEVGRKWVETGRSGQGRWVPVYGWGDDVKQIGKGGIAAFLLVTHWAATGLPGGQGGNAGLAGKPGNGGNGGSVSVRSLGDLPATIKTTLGAGEKGAQAKHGGPGDGNDGGLGAKYRYKSSVGFVDTDWAAFDESAELRSVWDRSNTVTDHFKNLNVDGNFVEGEGNGRKLKLRANSGAHGKKGGYGSAGVANAPAIPSSADGHAGNYTPGKTDATGKAYRNVPYPYLLMLQRSATGALLNRDNDEAADILRWLMLLTTDDRNAGSSAPQEAKDRQRLYYEAEQALLTRDRDESAGNRAPRCVYKDIKSYSDFVETLLGHVARQEKNFKSYLTAEEKSAARKTALDDSIKEAESRVKHLTGDTLTPGSILYYLEKEKQLKAAISDLGVQLLDYKHKLESMPRTLQEEIDGEIRKKTEMSIWTVLELVGMAAGIAINFAGAVGSLKEMVGKVKDFYKTTMELSTIGEILKEGIWKKEFTQIKEDLGKLLETDEWEKLSKDTKKFITSVTDFRAKIAAYDEIINSRKNVKFELDTLDVEASVLIFDTAKLELKKQRNEFEAFIRKFIDEYKQAQAWKHLFADYFDTTETRFDMLAHLADIQAERRELEYQRTICQRNLALLAEELNKLNFHPENVQGDDVRTGLEANLNIAIDQALNRIIDEGRAFTIWTLQIHEFPKIPKNLNSDILRSKFHEPVWERIKTALSSTNPPANRDFSDSPFVWKREDYKQEFELFDKNGRITLSLPVDKRSNKYFERLIDARIYLRGAKAKAGSAFYCILRHRGISDFLNSKHEVTTCYQEPRTIEFSYIVEGEQAKPNYDHSGAIKQSFDDDEKNLKRIRYSPYATWEVQIVSNYQQDERSSTVYNQDIALNSIQAIELRGRAFFSSFNVTPRNQST